MKKNPNRVIAEFFYLHETVLSRHIRNGVPFRKIYEVLSSSKKSRKQKKCFLYNYQDKHLTTTIRDNIWERLMADKNFIFTSLYDSQYKGTIEDLLGGE